MTVLADRLPSDIRSRHIDAVNGLRMHILEAGYERTGAPVLLLLHGFPELAFSWRRIMPRLAEAGYRVIAPDLRGYGDTTGWDRTFDGDIASFGMLNLVSDCVALLARMEIDSVDAVIGHDFGSPLAAFCALIRPDLFRSVALMSAPFGGPPAYPRGEGAGPPAPDIHAALAALERPRKHYQWYYSTRVAAQDLDHPEQGMQAFLRAYFHMKSADWADNQPYKLAGWTADELAKMPTYYLMDHDATMPETVAPHMPGADQITTCDWLPDTAMAVYSEAYERTGFQGGLNWYRNMTSEQLRSPLQLFSGRTIDVPACYIAGAQDWGIYQAPGALEVMEQSACTDYRGSHIIAGAGHWVQQEQPDAVTEKLLAFLDR